MTQDLDFPAHLGSRCTDRVLMNVARPRNTIDILEYGTQDLLSNVHTDIIIVTEEGRKIGIHACVLSSASSVISHLMSTVINPGFKQVIFLPDFKSLTVMNLRALLYGSSVILSNSQIERLMMLNQILNIQLKISVSSATNEACFDLNQKDSNLTDRQIQSFNIKSRNKTILGQIEITRNSRNAQQGDNLSKFRDLDNSGSVRNLNSYENGIENSNEHLENEYKGTANNNTEARESNLYINQSIGDQVDTGQSLFIYEDEHESLSLVNLEIERQEVDGPVPEGHGYQQVELQNYHRPASEGLHFKNIEDYFVRRDGGEDTGEDVGQVQLETSVKREVHSPSGLNTIFGELVNNQESNNLQQESSNKETTETRESNMEEGLTTTDGPELLQEETVKTLGVADINNAENKAEDLPLLCWYCNKEFDSFQSLCDHINTHSGSNKFSRRHHRCPRCGEVLHSTWKLRQHLTTHHTDKSKQKEDHQYAEKPRKSKTIRKPKGDHGYATITMCKQLEQKSDRTSKLDTEDVRASPDIKNESPRQENESLRQGRKKRRMNMIVSNEHSYGTKRDSSPETEQCDEDEKRIDHAYSSLHPSLTSSPVAANDHAQYHSTSNDHAQYHATSHDHAQYHTTSNDHAQYHATSTDHAQYHATSNDNSKSPRDQDTNQDDTVKLRGQRISQNYTEMSSKLIEKPEGENWTNDRQENISKEQLHAQHINQSQLCAQSSEFQGKTQVDINQEIRGKMTKKNLRKSSRKAKSFPCSKCDKTFPENYRLNRHTREVHDKEKHFKCNVCPAEFFKSSSLLRHMVSVHMEYRPYTCRMCSTGFKDSKALKYHEERNVCVQVTARNRQIIY